MKKLVLTLIAIAIADVKIEIGKTTPSIFSTNGTIVLKGKGGTTPTPTPIPANEPNLNLKSNEIEKNISIEEFNRFAENAIVKTGAKKRITTQTQVQTQTQTVFTTSATALSATTPKGVFAKEIPIPTDFKILSIGTPIGAPAGLPNYSFETASDKQLKSLEKHLKNSSINTSTDLAKTNTDLKEVEKTQFEKVWLDLFKREADLIMLSGLPMRLLIVPENDEVIQNFMKADLQKTTFKDAELGRPLLDGKKIPVCYINLKNESSIENLANKIDKEGSVAYFIGKNTAYCLDQLEREMKLFKKNTWLSTEVAQIGLEPQNFRKLFPYGLKPKDYAQAKEKIWTPQQTQYQEDFTKLFGELYAYNRGYKKIMKPTFNMRLNSFTLSQLWKIARAEQKKFVIVNTKAKTKTNPNITKTNITKLKQKNTPVNFNDQKQFNANLIKDIDRIISDSKKDVLNKELEIKLEK